MVVHVTSDGDMLDMICWRHYGRVSGVVETVLEANPGLAGQGAVYETGREIVLPEIASPIKADSIRLWS